MAKRKQLYTGKLAKRIPWTDDEGAIKRKQSEAFALLLKHHVGEARRGNEVVALSWEEEVTVLAWALALQHVPAFRVAPRRKNARKLSAGVGKRRRGAPVKGKMGRAVPLPEQHPKQLLRTVNDAIASVSRLGPCSVKTAVEGLLAGDARALGKPVVRYWKEHSHRLQQRYLRAKSRYSHN